MAEPLVSTTLHLDRERTLRFDYDALELIAGLPAIRRGGGEGKTPLQLWLAANGMDIDAMAVLLWAGARHEDKEFTLDKAKAALRISLKLRRHTLKEINDGINAAMNQSEVLGIFTPPPSDEEMEGNAPRSGEGG